MPNSTKLSDVQVALMRGESVAAIARDNAVPRKEIEAERSAFFGQLTSERVKALAKGPLINAGELNRAKDRTRRNAPKIIQDEMFGTGGLGCKA